jgi:hypothetical protein
VTLQGTIQIAGPASAAGTLIPPRRSAATGSYAPGILTYVRTAGATDPVAIHADGPLITPQSPAARGETLVIFVIVIGIGIGDLTPPRPTNRSVIFFGRIAHHSRRDDRRRFGAGSVHRPHPRIYRPGPNHDSPGVQAENASILVSFGSSVSQPGLALGVL